MCRRWGVIALVMAAGWAQSAEKLVSTGSELEDALGSLTAGDENVLSDGDWNDLGIRFRGEGTKEKPIKLRSQTIGGAGLTGESWIRMYGRHLIVEGLVFERGSSDGADVIQFREDSDEPAALCRVTRCSIIDFNPPEGDKTSYRWVRMDGFSNRLDHCHFEGKSNYGATVVIDLRDRPNHHRIDHNHFGPRPPLNRNGGETIRIGDSRTSLRRSGSILEDNLFEQCDGEIEIISVKSCDKTRFGNAMAR